MLIFTDNIRERYTAVRGHYIRVDISPTIKTKLVLYEVTTLKWISSNNKNKITTIWSHYIGVDISPNYKRERLLLLYSVTI